MEGHKMTSAGSVPYPDSGRKEAVLECIDGPRWNLEFMTMSSMFK